MAASSDPDPEPATDVPVSALLAPPANDACGGAIVIPDGPYPVLSAVTTSVDQATGAGDPLNTCSPTPIENGIWYKWTPSVGGQYTMSTCAGTTSTTDGDGVLAVFTSGGGCGGAFTQVAGGCNDDGCHPLGPASLSGVTFFAGTTYYILVSHYPTSQGGGSILTQAQIQINKVGTPFNDQCTGAEVIPTGGPFPYLTSVVDSAGVSADPELPQPSCVTFALKSLWYTFVPPVTGDYLLSTCAQDHGGTFTTATFDVMTIYTSLNGCVGPFTEIPTSGPSDGCDGGGCGLLTDQSFISTRLQGGTPYYIVIGLSGTPIGNVQLRVTGPPVNDVCATATPLFLDVPIKGTTAPAADDYRSPSTAQCYAGVGQTLTPAVGRDTVHTFTAPTADTYSFKLTSVRQQALYIGDCYGGPPPVTVSCIGGANRSTVIQEVMCVFLHAGQQVYVYEDEPTFSGGSYYSLSVNRCVRETEPNGTTASASPLACGTEASINPSSDVDFFSLGAPAAGSRAFVSFDHEPAGTSPVAQLRITDIANTLQYSNTPATVTEKYVAGTPLPGGNVYVRMNPNVASVFEPYRIFYTIQPPLASASPESEPNNSIATANTTLSGYIYAFMNPTDVDYFRFNVCKGDTILIFLDEDPRRDTTPILGAIDFYDAGGNLIAHAATNIANTSSTPGVGLTANTPFSQAENVLYKADYSGAYYVGLSNLNSDGDYLLSISLDCQPLGSLASDLSVTMADAPDPVSPGNTINYTLTMTNTGLSIARDVTLSSATPPNTTFLNVSAPPEWTCLKPTVGGTGSITCTAPYLEAGSKPVTLAVRVDNGTANGTIITGNATIANCHSDPNMANNAASTSTTVTTGASLPPAGLDCFSTTMSVRVNLLPSFHPGGCTETLSLTGPAKIWRGNPFDPGDGRDEVPTVMGCYQLTGTSSGGACGLGSLLARPSATLASLGQVKSSVDNVIYPADARFDLVLTMDTSAGIVHAEEASRVTTVLTALPPPPSSTFTGNGITHTLYDASGTVIGDIEVLQDVLQSPIACPCACSPALTLLGDKQTVNMAIPGAGTGVEYDLVRGTTAVVGANWPMSFLTATCAQGNGGPAKLEPLAATVDQLVWYLSRDGAFGSNGTYNQCPGAGQVGDRDADLAAMCP